VYPVGVGQSLFCADRAGAAHRPSCCRGVEEC
jgi:hypothetical protein